MGTLLFDISGKCLKEIGGDAVPDIPGATAVPRPDNLAGIPLHRLRLVAGVVEQSVLTQEQQDAVLEATIQDKFTRTLLTWVFETENWKRSVNTYLFNVESRLRVLESKPAITNQQFNNTLAGLDQITRAQFIAALKAKLGL